MNRFKNTNVMMNVKLAAGWTAHGGEKGGDAKKATSIENAREAVDTAHAHRIRHRRKGPNKQRRKRKLVGTPELITQV